MISELKKSEDLFPVTGGACECFCKPHNYNPGSVPNMEICNRLCQKKIKQDGNVCVPISGWDFVRCIESLLVSIPDTTAKQALLSKKIL